MPLNHYGVLKGQAIETRREDGQSTPHYQVHVRAGVVDFRLAVNIQSQASPSELMFLVNDNFQHPITISLTGLPDGFTALASAPGGGALDYLRGNLFNRSDMRTLPPSLPGPDNDLSDRLEHFFARAIAEPAARIFAFGQRWGPEPTTPDSTFAFLPGNGVHDIHMNQGNVAPFLGDDGVWQDGGVLMQFPSTGQWVGVFLAFQSQAWHTDDVTGHTMSDGSTSPDRTIHIVGALVNPIGPAPERETVTLLNASPAPADLAGWQIADRLDHRYTLSGTIGAGAALVVTLPSTVQLGNSGGLITLLNGTGLKVDGVSYTKEQAQREGWTLVF